MVMAQSLSTLILLATQWQISREAVLFQLHYEIFPILGAHPDSVAHSLAHAHLK